MICLWLGGAGRAEEPLLADAQWLPPGSNLAATLAAEPLPYFATEAAGGRRSLLTRLGELAFRAPAVLGGQARLRDLACATCHGNGHAHTAFFVPGLSDRPGNVDVTADFFNPAHDDGRFNPVNIPSLRGVADTAPYGRQGRFASLREFTRHAIVVEFDGPEPTPWLLDALVAYLNELGFLPSALLDASGGLLAQAGTAARRGEALFRRPYSGLGGRACASCHPPSAHFTDRQRHDVGTGGVYDTPSLLGGAVSAPYGHDGRFRDFPAVIAHFDRQFGLALKRGERADLAAYLAAVGSADQPSRPIALAGDLDRLQGFLPLLEHALAEDWRALGGFVAGALRHELGRLAARFPPPDGRLAQAALVERSRLLQAMQAAFEAGDFGGASDRHAALRAGWPELSDRLAAAAARSLYDPARLGAASMAR